MEEILRNVFFIQALVEKYKSSRSKQDFQNALDYVKICLNRTTIGSPLNDGCYIAFEELLVIRFADMHEPEDYDGLIDLIEYESLSIGHKLSGESFDQLKSLQAKAEARYRNSITLEHLNTVIETTREAIGRQPKNHTYLAGRMQKLQRRLTHKYEITGDMNNLDEAIRLGRTIVHNTPGGSNCPGRAFRLSDLICLLEDRFDKTDNLIDLEDSINLSQEMIKCLLPTNPKFPALLGRLVVLLYTRYEVVGSLEDFEAGASAAKQALDSIPSNHPGRAIALMSFVATYQRISEQQKKSTMINEALLLADQCAESTSRADVRALCTTDKAHLLMQRYMRTNDTKDLDEAVQIVEQNLKSSSVPSSLENSVLRALGKGLMLRYDVKGDMGDLEQAGEIMRQAVKLQSAQAITGIEIIQNLNCLGYFYARRYERTNEIADLDKAIHLTQEAVESTPRGKIETSELFNNFALLLREKHQRTGSVSDLDKGIRILQQGLECEPADSLDYAIYSINLAGIFKAQYEATKAIEKLSKGIDMMRKSIAFIPDTHPSLPMYISNLGGSLLDRYQDTCDVTDLNEAIDLIEKAITLVPDDHPYLVTFLRLLGDMFQHVFQRTKDTDDFNMALGFYLCGWNSSASRPLSRIWCGVRALGMLSHLPMSDVGIDLGMAVLGLMQVVHTRSLGRGDQEDTVSRFKGVTSILFAWLLSADRLDDALQCFEQGRTVIISQMIDDRYDLSAIMRRHPIIAGQYQSLITEINTPHTPMDQQNFHSDFIKQRRKIVGQLDECIRNIRCLPGCERFLMGKTVCELQECAGDGTIVIINVAPFQSDAVLISAKGILQLEIPKRFTLEANGWLSKNWRPKKRSEHYIKNQDFSAYLAWLWDNCVKFIIEKIESMQENHKNVLPKVWWIGSGSGSSMPFHAAGYHNKGSLENAYSRVVSSYTPSIKALAYSRSQSRLTGRAERNHMLITLMPTSPKGPNEKTAPKPLHGVLKEKEKIMAVACGNINTTVLDHPSSEEVLKMLPKSSIAHFACHGISDNKDPSNSGLILQRRDQPDQPIRQDRLTVEGISHLKLKGVQIAYLSACSTADNRDNKINDEAIHVVSGFQVAGFPHVVGCLWPAGDSVCVKVAEEFYSLIFDKSKQSTEVGDIAWKLQRAVMSVREQLPTMPLEWAQFVHYGA